MKMEHCALMTWRQPPRPMAAAAGSQRRAGGAEGSSKNLHSEMGCA
jgi:hypothetical protein